MSNPTAFAPASGSSSAPSSSSSGAGAGAGGAANVAVPLMDWERFIGMLATDILREQSPRCLLNCRSKLYELLVNCVPADVIVRRLSWVLASELGKTMPEALKYEVVHWCAHYEHRLALGSGGKELFHMEAMIAKLMSVLKTSGWSGAGVPAAGR